MPSDIVISGTLLNGENDPARGVRLFITPLSVAGAAIHDAGFYTSRSDLAGAVSFTLIQGATYNIKGPVLGFNSASGTDITMPSEATATVESLVAVASYPSTGLTVFDEAANLGLFTTVKFLGSGVAAAPLSAGVLGVTITSGGVTDATFITQTPHAGLSAEQALSTLSTGLVKVTNGTGVLSTAGASDLPSGIDAAKLADGSVTNAEFQRLDATSSIQSQLDSKAALVHTHIIGDVTGLQAALDAKPTQAAADALYQPLDGDLSVIAGLSASNDDIVQRKAGAWVNRTPAQFKADLVLVKADVGLGNLDNLQQQPIDATLTALAGLTVAADKLIYATGADAFAVTDFSAFGRSLIDDANAGVARGTLGAQSASARLDELAAIGSALQVPRVNAGGTAIEWHTPSGGGTTINATDGVLPYRSSSSAFSDSPLVRADANTIEQRNNTNGQAFNLYRTFTDASNYERGFFKWNGTILEIGTTGAGTGDPDRTLKLRPGGAQYNFDAFGNVSGFGSLDVASSRFAVSTANGLELGSAMAINWYDSTQVFGTNDLRVKRIAAGVWGLENPVGGGGAIQLKPKSATPANPASSSEFNLYNRGAKVVYQYNDAGTVKYLICDMTQAAGTAVWTVTTTAP